MFLRHKVRRKDGKEHRYWSIVENRRASGGRTVQRHVLYLGEINDSQRAAWCRTIEAFDEDSQQARQIALFPEDRQAPTLNCDVVHVRLSGLRLHRPRQWGACWLACHVWDQLRLDDFWSPRLPTSREGTRWLDVLKTLVAYRLIDPGSEWRRHRQWYEQSAMGDLLGADFALAHKDTLYRSRHSFRKIDLEILSNARVVMVDDHGLDEPIGGRFGIDGLTTPPLTSMMSLIASCFRSNACKPVSRMNMSRVSIATARRLVDAAL